MSIGALTELKKKSYFWPVLFGLVLLVSIIIRFYDLSIRPFHNDEGVNYLFVKKVLETGYYPYSHENYHGPLYFYLLTLSNFIFGINDFGMRFPSIVFSLASILLILMLRRTEGLRFCLIAMCFIGLSSSQVFHARYAIHEMFFVLSGALFGFSVYLWHRIRNYRYLLTAGIGLGMLISIKETFIITIFSIFWAFIALCLPGILQAFKNWSKFSLGESFSLARFEFIDLYQQRQKLFWGLLLSLCVILLSFSGGLQWMGGLRELFLGVPQWIGRNESDVGHFKPFWYYGSIFFGKAFFVRFDKIFHTSISTRLYETDPAELSLILLLIIPIVVFFVKERGFLSYIFLPRFRFCIFTSIWTLTSFLVYAYVKYKTPWLIIGTSYPAYLCLAAMLNQLLDSKFGHKYFPIALLGLCLFITGSSSFKYNFEIPYGPGNPYSYVHTSPGMMDLVDDLEKYRKEHPNARILIAVNAYWPLPYYLRDSSDGLGYLKTDDIDKYKSDYEILIMNHTVKKDVPGYYRKYYRLTEAQETETYFKIESSEPTGEPENKVETQPEQ